jgi:hypothetical protein
MSSLDRGFARKKITWSADDWIKGDAVTLGSGNFLESQMFSVQRGLIDTQW